MAIDLKTLFEAHNAKIIEKINALKDLIPAGAGAGGGISADAGNNLYLGTDQKPMFIQRTAAQIGTAYESLANTNKFTDAYKATLDGFAAAIDGKADIDPNTNKLVLSQMPEFKITNVVSPSENTFAAFLGNSNNYTFNVGDVISITDTNGNVENYMYAGGDAAQQTSYTSINQGQVKFFDTLPATGLKNWIYAIYGTTNGLYLWDEVAADWIAVSGAGAADHNTLNNKQGGQAGEYYHLTAAQHAAAILPQNHLHDQPTPSATWVITHALNKEVSVTVFDTANTEVEGEVIHDSLTQITIKFNAAFSGKATLN